MSAEQAQLSSLEKLSEELTQARSNVLRLNIKASNICKAVVQATCSYSIPQALNLIAFEKHLLNALKETTNDENAKTIGLVLTGAICLGLYFASNTLTHKLLPNLSTDWLLSNQSKRFFKSFDDSFVNLREADSSALQHMIQDANFVKTNNSQNMNVLVTSGVFSHLLMIYNLLNFGILLFNLLASNQFPASLHFYVVAHAVSFFSLILSGYFSSKPLVPGVTVGLEKVYTMGWDSYGKKKLGVLIQQELKMRNEEYFLFNMEQEPYVEEDYITLHFSFKSSYIKNGLKTTNIKLIMRFFCVFLHKAYAAQFVVDDINLKVLGIFYKPVYGKKTKSLYQEMQRKIMEYCFVIDETIKQLNKLLYLRFNVSVSEQSEIGWMYTHHQADGKLFELSLTLPFSKTDPRFTEIFKFFSTGIFKDNDLQADAILIKMDADVSLEQTILKIKREEPIESNQFDRLYSAIRLEKQSQHGSGNSYTNSNSFWETPNTHLPQRRIKPQPAASSYSPPQPITPVSKTTEFTLPDGTKMTYRPGQAPNNMVQLTDYIFGILIDNAELMTPAEYKKANAALHKGIVSAEGKEGVVWDPISKSYKIKMTGNFGDERILGFPVQGTDGRSIAFIFSAQNYVYDYHKKLNRHAVTVRPNL